MGVGSPSLQQDGGDECRLCVLHVAFGELPLLQLLRVACRLDVGQRGQMGAVMTGGGGVGAVGYLLEKNLPVVGSGRVSRREWKRDGLLDLKKSLFIMCSVEFCVCKVQSKFSGGQ